MVDLPVYDEANVWPLQPERSGYVALANAFSIQRADFTNDGLIDVDTSGIGVGQTVN